MYTKKFLLCVFSAVAALSLILTPSDAMVFAAPLITTQEDVATVNSQDTLMTYCEFNSKAAGDSYLIPGLVSAVSYDKNKKKYSTVSTMCPQAMCKVGHYTLITAYDSDENCRSVIFVLDSARMLVKTLVLPDSYHVGGIAYDSQNEVILITKASASAVGVISLEDFNKYMSFSSSFVQIKYTIEENESDNFISSASSVTYKGGRVYIGTFDSSTASYAYCYIPVYDKAANKYTLYYQYKFSLPSYTQGFTIAQYKGKTRMFASVSYGRNETKGIYCSYIYSYVFNETDGSKSFDNILSAPPMLQQTYVEGGKLYCLFESASAVYRDVSVKPLSYVVSLKLSALCDEKKGEFVDISVSDVNGGKKVSVTSSVPDSTIYYSASMPYYRYGKMISTSYVYKKSYTKTNTGMVYAVAVSNGRIVAADAVYVNIGKASAPSKPKIKATGKSSITVSWSKASGATGYQIYSSTSKNSGYKLAATVSSSKTSYKNTGLKKNKKYYYKIRAVRKGYLNSKYTSVVSAKTKK